MVFGNSGAAMPRSTTSSSSLTPTRGTPARSKVRSLISLRPSSCSNVSLFAGDFYGQPVNFGRDHYLARKSGGGATREIGRAHVWTPVTNAHLVCRLLLEKKNKTQ